VVRASLALACVEVVSLAGFPRPSSPPPPSVRVRLCRRMLARRTGQWRSRWTIAFTSPAAATLTGVSEISTHYFENGNMQMNATKRHAAAIAFAVRTAKSPPACVPKSVCWG
jgi:hypothetical protein